MNNIFYNNIFYEKGELKDKKIIDALEKAAVQYSNGEIVEVKNLLSDIVFAIDAFEKQYEV